MSAWTDAVAAIATAPSAWYRANGDFLDATGHARHLTERSSAVPTAYVAGTTNDGDQAVHGYGTRQYIVGGVNQTWMDPPSALSFVCWFKTNGPNGNVGIMGRADSITGSYFYNQWRCFIDGSGNLVLEVVQANAVPAGNITTTGHDYRDSTWHMVAGVWKSGNLKLYVDGTLYATVSSGVAAALYGDVTWPLSFGCFGGSAGGTNNPITANSLGAVDEGLVWYGYELTALEIGDLYDAPFAPIPPGVPTTVTVDTITTDSATIHWGAPVTGDPPTGYVIRLDHDAGTEHAEGFAVFDYEWTGLDPDTSYTLSVAAYNFGGTSAFVDVGFDTLDDGPPPPPGYYRIELELDTLSWMVEQGDPPTYGPLLPITLGWEIPEGVEYFPAQAGLTTLGFDVQVQDASDLAGVVRGSRVAFRLYVDDDPDADPWQTFAGIVTQLDGEVVPGQANYDEPDFRVHVYAADDTARLADIQVGYTDDWPVENIVARAARICDEAGVTYDDVSYDGGVGWLAARDAGQPMSALEALRQTFKDAAEEYTSEFPDVWYGRPVFWFDPDLDGTPPAPTVYVRSFRRRVFPDTTITLDGGKTDRVGAWVKAPGPAAASWVIVDGATFGTDDGTVPFVKRTSLLDWFGDPPGTETNYSADERAWLGRSLLPDGSTALDGWSSRALVYEAWLDPAPVTLWASYAPIIQVFPVVITPLDAQLEVNAEDYLAGTLTAARLILAGDGRYRIEFRLRAELLPGTDLP